MPKQFWLLLCMWLLFLLMPVAGEVNGLERCKAYVVDVRTFHRQYFGLDFPYWFSVGQLEVESACRHNVLSSDGVGSEGLAQITWKWWKTELAKEGVLDIKSIPNHLKAQSFINSYYYNRLKWCEKKLWAMYQAYNGGLLVEKECNQAKSSIWSEVYRFCQRKDVCVQRDRITGHCKQWRNACEINYEYSWKVWSKGRFYRPWEVVGGKSKFDYW